MERPDWGPNGAWGAVISARRPDNVGDLSERFGPLTWYVPEDEVPYYEQFGAPNIQPVPLVDGKPNNLCESRNAALDDAHERGLPCLMTEDDFQRVRVKDFDSDDDNSTLDATPEWASDYLLRALDATPYKFAGVQPTDNPFFSTKPVGLRNYIIGSLIAVEPTPLRFDEGLMLKEDYDYTCQHIEEYGGALRVGALLPTVRHYDNPGGAVDVRTTRLEQETIAQLMEKWPEAIHEHPSRENEVVLRWPSDDSPPPVPEDEVSLPPIRG